MNKAFVLGAGLGTRLGKLTECIPKPLIPVFGKPLIEFAFEHLINSGISGFVVNTHHKADAYHDHFPDGMKSTCWEQAVALITSPPFWKGRYSWYITVIS